MSTRWSAISLAAACALAVACGGGQKRTVIQNKGSDTLVNVAQAWAEGYKTANPNVAVAVSGGGSGVGIAALIDGTVDVANSSRELGEKEIALAEKKGFTPVEHVVGFDALAIYVHKDNPIESISVPQLRAIYQEGGEITRWSQLGITLPGDKNDEIVRVSRQNNSGTYAYFREAVFDPTGEFKLGSLDMHGSKDVVEQVGKTVGAIGYSGLAYATHEVRILPVSMEDGSPPVEATIDSALDRTYPIARPLFMYTRGEPVGEVKAYIDWILSPAGQKVIEDKGYAPVKRF